MSLYTHFSSFMQNICRKVIIILMFTALFILMRNTASANNIDYNISTLNTVTMCVDPDWEPYEQITANGEYIGIAADLIKLISSRSNISLKLIPTKNWSESIKFSKEGRCDIIAFLNQTEKRNEWLLFTQPYFIDKNIFITREEHDYISDLAEFTGETVVLPKGTSIEEKLRRDYPNIKIITSENESEALKMVENRTADITLRSLTVAAYTIKNEGWFNLKISGEIPSYSNKFRIGVVKSKPELVDILNKAVKTITPFETREIINKHVSITLSNKDNSKIIIKVVLAAGVLFFISLFWIFYLKRTNKKVIHLSNELSKELEYQELIKSKLMESETKYRFITDNAVDVIWHLDLNYCFTYLSPSDEKIRGYTQDEVLGKCLWNQLKPEGIEHVKEVNKKRLAAEENGIKTSYIRYELEQLCKNGTWIWTEVNVSPYRDKDGNMTGYHGVTRDVSERKRMEQILKESEERYRLLIDTVQEGIGVIQNEKFVFCNPMVEKITGYSCEELKTISFLNLVSPEDFDMAKEQYGNRINNIALNHRYKIRIINKSNDYIWLEVSGILIDWNGAPAVLVFMADISERIVYEEKIKHMAQYDILTNLPNRSLFMDRLQQALAIAQRDKHKMAVLFIDLNKFKPVNDTFGHAVGDSLLKAVAKRLTELLRASDTVARVGGDEFILLLPSIDNVNDADIVADKIRSAISKPFDIDGHTIYISTSVGISVYPDSGETEHELLHVADNNMYEEKYSK